MFNQYVRYLRWMGRQQDAHPIRMLVISMVMNVAFTQGTKRLSRWINEKEQERRLWG